MLSTDFKRQIASFLSEKQGKPVVVENTHTVGGGCINEAMRLETSAGDYFVKWNEAQRFPGMPASRQGWFEAEVEGLELLRRAGEIEVPEVLLCGGDNDRAFLLLQFIHPGKRENNFFHDFGRRLAKLHRHSAAKFGLIYDNYIGSLPQSNAQHSTWPDFFIAQRLVSQMKLASDSHRLDRSTNEQMNRLFKHLPSLFPTEPPSLLHGDLWSGNFMTGTRGTACIFDPAVYYGHREMDIAMTKLFGGFDASFYEGYNEEYPLEKGWEERVDICNLYPLLVHINLFGGSYIREVESILKRF